MSPQPARKPQPRRQPLLHQHTAIVDLNNAPLSLPPTAPAPLSLTAPPPAATQQQERILPSNETHWERETDKESNRAIEEDEGSFEDPFDGSGPYPNPLAASSRQTATAAAANDDHGLSKPSALCHSAADAKMLRECSFSLLYLALLLLALTWRLTSYTSRGPYCFDRKPRRCIQQRRCPSAPPHKILP